MKNEIKKFFIYFNLIFTYTFKRKNVVVVVVIFYIAACNLKFDCNDILLVVYFVAIYIELKN